MAVSHAFSNAVADWTGTVTGFNSQGATVTIAATDIVRPTNWNSVHNDFFTLTGNTNNASTLSGSNIFFQGLGGVTLRGSSNSLGISAGAHVTHSQYAPFDESPLVTGQQGNGTLHLHPIQVPNIQHDRIGFYIHFSNATNSSGSGTLSIRCGIYTRNVSTLSLLSSTSSAFAFTNSGTVGIFSSLGGPRLVTIPWTNTLAQGDYWFGVVTQTTTGGANCSISQLLASKFTASAFSGIFSQASNATHQRRLGLGVLSASTAAMPASVAFSNIQGTATLAFHPPNWMMISQTA